MNYNFQKICQDLLRDLPQRVKEVVSRRFALSGGGGPEGETLEEIGKSFGITRERVRQIEESGLEKIRPEIKKYQNIQHSLSQILELEVKIVILQKIKKN